MHFKLNLTINPFSWCFNDSMIKVSWFQWMICTPKNHNFQTVNSLNTWLHPANRVKNGERRTGVIGSIWLMNDTHLAKCRYSNTTLLYYQLYLLSSLLKISAPTNTTTLINSKVFIIRKWWWCWRSRTFVDSDDVNWTSP